MAQSDSPKRAQSAHFQETEEDGEAQKDGSPAGVQEEAGTQGPDETKSPKASSKLTRAQSRSVDLQVEVDKHLEGMQAEKKHQQDRLEDARGRRSKKTKTQQFQHCKSAVARSSVTAIWFADRSEEEIANLRDLGETRDFCAGSFTDYLERSRVHEMKLLKKEVNTTCTLERQLTQTSQTLVKNMQKRFENYKAEVHYEKLKDDLMQLLIKFWRARGDKRWAPQGIECLKKHVRQITKGKQKKKCLIIDVNFYEMKYKLQCQPAKGLEHQDERHDRLRDFFKQYHDSQSKVDLQMPCSEGQLRLVDLNPKAAHHAFSKSLGSRPDTRDAAPELPESSDNDGVAQPQISKIDTWKTRHVRGKHVPFGMELPRRMSREVSKMTDTKSSFYLPPVSPQAGLSSSQRLSGTLTSCLSTSMLSTVDTPSLGGSATLTGGWGLDGRWPRNVRRHETAEAMARLDQSPLSRMSQRREPTDSNQSQDMKVDKQLHRADKAFRGIITAAGRDADSRPSSATSAAGGATRPMSMRQLTHSATAPSLWHPLSPGGSSSPSGSHGRQTERGPFIKPWGGSSAAAELRRTGVKVSPESPTGKYLRETELNCLSPKLIPFITGHSNDLTAKNQAFNDCDLLAIGTMVNLKDKITQVDLHGNPLLSEKSLVPFLNKLYGQPVEKLSLNGCLHSSLPPGIKETLQVVESLLVDPNGLKWLRSLDLSGIAIGLRTHVPLCQAIQEHPRITDVRLADTGIHCSVAKECIGQLMSSTTIEVLDLSYNCFNPEVFRTLGERLAGMYNLLSLSVANCSSHQAGLDNPIAYFIEHLSRNTRLTHVDLSTNRITFRGALVIEDALEQHKKLSDLSICNNPIGVLGMRCLLRLLSRDTSGLVHISGEGVAGGTLMEALSEKMQVFRASSPSGFYDLNLARPYHRSLLRMLYKTCDRFGIGPDIAFRELSFRSASGSWTLPHSHAVKDAESIYVVPQDGKLSFVFNIVSTTDGPLKGVPHDDLGKFVSQYEDRGRIKVGFKKIVPLFAYWKNLTGRAADQVYMLEALCKDFSFTWEQIEVMCRCRCMITQVLWRLMPCISGGAPASFLPSRLALHMGEYHQIFQKAFLLESFNPDNPTGRYKLHLENPSDYLIAERLILLDRWEVSLATRNSRTDISQKGNMSHIRNEKFQELPILNERSIMEWGLPEWDHLEFDYVSGKRPPPDAPVLDDVGWNEFLVAFQQATCSQTWQLQALRNVSDDFYISSTQLRQLLSIFSSEDVRQDIFVLLFLRLTDIVNEKISRVRFDGKTEVLALRQRLGHMTYFPFIQPEQAYFEFEMMYHEQRLALSSLLQLAAKESRMGFSNIRDVEYRLSDNTLDPLVSGIPPSWSFIDKAPTTGTFKCTYNCAPEERKIAERKRLMELYGFWQGPNTDADVNWWLSIGEAPQEVLDFVDFIVLHYKNVYDAFTDVDGPDGNRNISLREFEEGVARMKMPKLKGKTKVDAVFRYLDPSGEGQVSEKEWGVLEQLFKEIRMCIGEFVWFLDRTFDDWDEAWDFLDDDGSGSLSMKEWMDASTSIGYFGPAKPIFSHLDVDGGGFVSIDEFKVLRDFQPSLSG